MAKVLATLILILSFSALVHGEDGAVYFPAFQEKAPNGYYYLSSNREHVFVCGGRLITSAGNPRVICLPPAIQAGIEALWPKKQIYWDRIAILKTLP